LTSWFIPKANLVVSQTYYLRARYRSGTDPGGTGIVAVSSYSTAVTFSTNNTFDIPPGTPMGGGYFGGYISTAGNGVADYALIVAPRATGQFGGNAGGPTNWGTSNTGDTNPPSQNQVYGKLATDAFTGGNYPAFNWAKGLNINGFNDWYIPAKNELEILYFNLKPTTDGNDNTSGGNPNAVPPRGGNYPSGSPATNPAQTTNTLFQSGGSEAFVTNRAYWTSTENSALTNTAWQGQFVVGFQVVAQKTDNNTARAIRRIPA
jgi:hypothetical protein